MANLTSTQRTPDSVAEPQTKLRRSFSNIIQGFVGQRTQHHNRRFLILLTLHLALPSIGPITFLKIALK